jgi:hypothetical protein
MESMTMAARDGSSPGKRSVGLTWSCSARLMIKVQPSSSSRFIGMTDMRSDTSAKNDREARPLPYTMRLSDEQLAQLARSSLVGSGAPPELINEAVDHIEEWLTSAG